MDYLFLASADKLDHDNVNWRCPAVNCRGWERGSMQEIAANKLQRCRNLIIACIYLLFGLHAARRAMFEDLRPADLAVGLAFQVIITTFCIVDSKCRGKPLLHSFYWIIFFSWPLSVPIYWVWTRSLKGIVLGVFFVISLVVVSVLAFFATGFLTGGEPWAR
jgi:hypothetical protein